jgi:hypothetical protein
MNIDFTDEELRTIYNIANYMQDRGMTNIGVKIQQLGYDDKWTKQLNQWNEETINEWNILATIKKKVKP